MVLAGCACFCREIGEKAGFHDKNTRVGVRLPGRTGGPDYEESRPANRLGRLMWGFPVRPLANSRVSGCFGAIRGGAARRESSSQHTW